MIPGRNVHPTACASPKALDDASPAVLRKAAEPLGRSPDRDPTVVLQAQATGVFGGWFCLIFYISNLSFNIQSWYVMVSNGF